MGWGRLPRSHRLRLPRKFFLTDDFQNADHFRHPGRGADHIEGFQKVKEAILVHPDDFDSNLLQVIRGYLAISYLRMGEQANCCAAYGPKSCLLPIEGSGIHQEPHHYYGGFTPYWYQRFLAQSGFQEIQIEANAGSFKFFSQESLRFLATTRPFARMPFLPSLLWLPFWLLLLPILGGLIPLACHRLDRYDRAQQFTVGYHVTAQKI